MDAERNFPAGKRWGAGLRVATSLALIVWLTIVILGPVTNPVATEELTVPVAQALAPIHQSLFLGHGYRFFAPDPGPGHRVSVRAPVGDNELLAFPDRDRLWPRLMYHRWFMLAETMWAEQRSLPPREEFQRMQQELAERAGQMALAGHQAIAASLRGLVDRQEVAWASANRRKAGLFTHVEREVRRRTGEEEARLVLQERLIPLPADVLLGARLGDARYLTAPDATAADEVIGE